MTEPQADPSRNDRTGTRTADAHALIRTAAWIALACAAAITGASAVSRLGVRPDEIAGPALAAAILGAVFAFRPAPGIAAFLLLTLMTQSVEHWLSLDLRYLDEFSVVAIVGVSATRNRSTIIGLRPGWKEGALGVAVLAGIASSLAGAVPIDTWLPALVLLTKGIAFFYAVSWLRMDVRDVERVSAVMLLAAAAVLLLGLVEAMDPVRFRETIGLPPFEEQRGEIAVLKSVFLHPAIFGWFTAFASLFLYARFFVLREWWALAAALLFNVGTLLSGRRRPVVGVLAALSVGAVWIWRGRQSPRTMLRVFAPLVAAIALVALFTAPALSGFYANTLDEYLLPGDLEEILSSDPDPALIAGTHPRVALYVGSLAIARDYFPLGAGLGRFGSYMSQAHYSPLYDRYGLTGVYGLGPDNPLAISDTFWPMVLAELGPVGLAALTAFFVLLVARIWRGAGANFSDAIRAFALGALFVMIEGLVGSFVAPTFVAAPIAYFVFGAAGSAVAITSGSAGAIVRGHS